MSCEHKRIHTERLFRPDTELEDGGFVVAHSRFFIESTCADCGQWLSEVEIRREDGGITSKGE